MRTFAVALVALLLPVLVAESPSGEDHPSPATALTLERGLLDLTALTLFGDQSLGKCALSLTMRVDPDGGVTIADIQIDRRAPDDDTVPGQVACGDIHACGRSLNAPEEAPTSPWRGTLRDEGGGASSALELDACLDTCLGRFRGPVELTATLDRAGGARLRARRAAVGQSGLELSADLRLEPVSR